MTPFASSPPSGAAPDDSSRFSVASSSPFATAPCCFCLYLSIQPESPQSRVCRVRTARAGGPCRLSTSLSSSGVEPLSSCLQNCPSPPSSSSSSPPYATFVSLLLLDFPAPCARSEGTAHVVETGAAATETGAEPAETLSRPRTGRGQGDCGREITHDNERPWEFAVPLRLCWRRCGTRVGLGASEGLRRPSPVRPALLRRSSSPSLSASRAPSSSLSRLSGAPFCVSGGSSPPSACPCLSPSGSEFFSFDAPSAFFCRSPSSQSSGFASAKSSSFSEGASSSLLEDEGSKRQPASFSRTGEAGGREPDLSSQTSTLEWFCAEDAPAAAPRRLDRGTEGDRREGLETRKRNEETGGDTRGAHPDAGDPRAYSARREAPLPSSSDRIQVNQVLCLYSWKLFWAAPCLPASLAKIPRQTVFLLARVGAPQTPSPPSTNPSPSASAAALPPSNAAVLTARRPPRERPAWLLLAPLADAEAHSTASLQPAAEESTADFVLQVTTGNSRRPLGANPRVLLCIHADLPLPQLLRLFGHVAAEVLGGSCLPRDAKLAACSGAASSEGRRDDSHSDSGLRASLGEKTTRPSRGNSRQVSSPPLLLSHIGWCSWDAYGTQVSAASVRRVAELVQPGWLLIDDGWQEASPYPPDDLQGNSDALHSLDGFASKGFGDMHAVVESLNRVLNRPFDACMNEDMEGAASAAAEPGDEWLFLPHSVRAARSAAPAGESASADGDTAQSVEKTASGGGNRGRTQDDKQGPSRVLLWHCLLGSWKGIQPSLADQLQLPVREGVFPTFPPGLRADDSTAQLEHWRRAMSVVPASSASAFYSCFYSHMGRFGIYGTKVDAQAMAALVTEGTADSAASAVLMYRSAATAANAAHLSRQKQQTPTDPTPKDRRDCAQAARRDNAVAAREGCNAEAQEAAHELPASECVTGEWLERGKEFETSVKTEGGDRGEQTLRAMPVSENIMSCMGMTVPNVYLSGPLLISRSSEDHAFHGVEETAEAVARHIWHNACNSLWLSPFFIPDWDMFRLCAWHCRIHAVARVISGGPVYISDPVDLLEKTDSGGRADAWRRLLTKLRLPGCPLPLMGRCTGLPRPTADSIFVDPLTTPRGYKVVNSCAAGLLLAVFGLHDSCDRPYSATITVADLIGYIHEEGGRSADQDDELETFLCTDLDERGWEACGKGAAGEDKINAALLDPRYGWTVTPLYYMSARLFALTPIFSTGDRISPSRARFVGSKLSGFEAIRLSLIGGRSRFFPGQARAPLGLPAGVGASASQGERRGDGAILLVAPLAPPFVFSVVKPRRGVWVEESDDKDGGDSRPDAECKGQQEAACWTALSRRCHDNADRRLSALVTEAAEEGMGGFSQAVRDPSFLQGVYFELQAPTVSAACSVLLWSDGPRPPNCCRVACPEGVDDASALCEPMILSEKNAILLKPVQSCPFGEPSTSWYPNNEGKTGGCCCLIKQTLPTSCGS
ncbi:hypothetical protein BESB_076170 [Besnoitia besnoiti]|uniref:galactinol--sucrose galactosyltransferase n=1 Tax=Besnoitia besnoiti TaxID=94643 RepID=A0A2A9MDE2_BESBE|nr:hypothetical protein BESB_076170 [Besnoitia besnoiti]PFH33400.1 hypothetical protein BESB_076170 [Besnoitia besnoiti]